MGRKKLDHEKEVSFETLVQQLPRVRRDVAAENPGYHRRQIARGIFGETSKIREELEELEDAEEQGVRVMGGCELADLYGALEARARREGLSMEDLAKMSALTAHVFKTGYRR